VEFVEGWGRPRECQPLQGLERRGYTPGVHLQIFCEAIWGGKGKLNRSDVAQLEHSIPR